MALLCIWTVQHWEVPQLIWPLNFFIFLNNGRPISEWPETSCGKDYTLPGLHDVPFVCHTYLLQVLLHCTVPAPLFPAHYILLCALHPHVVGSPLHCVSFSSTPPSPPPPSPLTIYSCDCTALCHPLGMSRKQKPEERGGIQRLRRQQLHLEQWGEWCLDCFWGAFLLISLIGPTV